MGVGRGSVYKRGEVWWIKWYRDGRPFRESSSSARKTDAQGLLARRLGDVSRGAPVSPKDDRMTFTAAAKAVTADYVLKRNRSIDGLERRLRKHLEPFFGPRRMVDISSTVIKEFIAKRKSDVIVSPKRKRGAEDAAPDRPVSDAEINRELAILKRAFSLAIQDGASFRRPHVPMLKENNVRQGFFEPEQFASVLSRLPEPLRPVIEFAYITGWRIPSEVLKLEWRQIDFSGSGEVRLGAGTTKNGEGRVFPMTQRLRALLQEQRDLTDAFRREKGRLCPSVFHRDGEPVKSFRKAFATACVAAGCPGRIPHDFRRTAVRNLVKAGISEVVAMRLTGHKTRSVFDRYNVVSKNDFEEAAMKLDNQANGHKTGT
jgi:integrase